jgi:hypothetical protein
MFSSGSEFKNTRLKNHTFLIISILLLVGLTVVAGQTRAESRTRKEVTFSKDVAPIFFNNCAVCHRPNDLAPMSLMTYKEARPWARSIKEKVVSREMPPWYADPHHGEFSNDRRLSQVEIDTIVAWIDQGAKEGNPKDLPLAPKFVEGWHIGKPDVVLTMTEEHTVEPTGPDDYLYFTVPTNFKEDMWVQAAEIKPGNKRVVHHVIAFIQTPEVAAAMKAANQPGRRVEMMPSVFYRDGTLNRVKPDAPVIDDGCNNSNGGSAFGRRGESPITGALLSGYAPGKDWDIWPEGLAKRIPAGSNIVLQMHYSKTTGKPEKDRSSIGLIFAKEPPKKMILTHAVANHFFKIPPGADNHEVTACYEFDRQVELVTYMPHMHVRGKDMKYEVVYPDGRKETLLWVPKYSFSWQQVYWLKKPVMIPKGTKFIVTAHFDNSTRNKYNPDPTKQVRFGDPTYDEMMIGWMDFAVDKPRARVVAQIDPAVYERYVGRYEIMPNMGVVITREGDKLLAQATGQVPVQLYPESETKFFLKVIEGEITFVTNDKGEATELLFTMNNQTMRARRVKSVASSAGK